MRNSAAHKHAPWRKTVLVPFWVFQLFFELWMVALLGLMVGVVLRAKAKGQKLVYDKSLNISVPLSLSFGVICLVLTITEIILLARLRLKPKAFVVMNVIKTALWTTIFIYDLVHADLSTTPKPSGDATKPKSKKPFAEWQTMIVEAVLALAFWIPLIYGCVVFHYNRQGVDNYKPGYAANEYDLPIDTADSAASYGQTDVEKARGAPTYARPLDPRFASYT